MSLLSDLNNKVKNLSARVAAQFKTQQSDIDSKVSTVNGIAPDENGNVELQMGASLPLGWEYTRLVSDTAPKGGADYLGQEGTREFYAALWDWVNTEHPGRVISEDDWQAMYAAQNGNVPYWSTGDGETTFRFPRVVSYLRAGDIAGQYTAEGLPNITGSAKVRGFANDDNHCVQRFGSGALYEASQAASDVMASSITGGTMLTMALDASRSSSIYGASDHVTPETITVVMGVIAFGEVQTVGTATEEGILAEIENIKGSYVKKSGDTMTGGLTVPYLRVAATNTELEGGELLLEAANESLYALNVDNYNNQFRIIYVASDETVAGVFRVYSTGKIELPNNTAFWIA